MLLFCFANQVWNFTQLCVLAVLPCSEHAKPKLKLANSLELEEGLGVINSHACENENGAPGRGGGRRFGEGKNEREGRKRKTQQRDRNSSFLSSFAQGRANLYLMKSWMWGEGYRKKKKWEMICSAHRKRKIEENQDTPSF